MKALTLTFNAYLWDEDRAENGYWDQECLRLFAEEAMAFLPPDMASAGEIGQEGRGVNAPV